MNSNQRSQENNQSDNGGNELPVSSSRAGKVLDTSAKPADPAARQSNDGAGVMPKSPAGEHLAADQKMDDDTGLSNTVNRPAATPDRQDLQSNVGRRSDGTPD
ncbi:MAG TPA: hypothetical protein VFS02_10350 [Telluria sp.]|nr:hypothetical protein [Telluria sp.]